MRFTISSHSQSHRFRKSDEITNVFSFLLAHASDCLFLDTPECHVRAQVSQTAKSNRIVWFHVRNRSGNTTICPELTSKATRAIAQYRTTHWVDQFIHIRFFLCICYCTEFAIIRFSILSTKCKRSFLSSATPMPMALCYTWSIISAQRKYFAWRSLPTKKHGWTEHNNNNNRFPRFRKRKTNPIVIFFFVLALCSILLSNFTHSLHFVDPGKIHFLLPR